ncbi:MAG: hypothetical protein H5U02_15170 [Clostridia bacterium]|nr:hypothetical protein [Clostridia bacterium]
MLALDDIVVREMVKSLVNQVAIGDYRQVFTIIVGIKLLEEIKSLQGIPVMGEEPGQDKAWRLWKRKVGPGEGS